MKKFFKYLFASWLGSLLAFGTLLLIGILVISAISKGLKKSHDDIAKEGVLLLDFNLPIPELTNNASQGNMLSFSTGPTIGLNDYVHYIKEAKTNDKIKGIYIKTGLVMNGSATIEVLQKAIDDFKTSGKFVIAYSDNYTQKGYQLSLAADSIFVNPIGKILLLGYAVESPFFKKMLDKYGIDAQVFHVGDFKGATEPFRFESYSENNKLQIRELLNARYQQLLSSIHERRKIPKDSIHLAIDNFLLQDIKVAKKMGFVNRLTYEDEVLNTLKKLCGKTKKDKIKLFTVNQLYAEDTERLAKKLNTNKEHIAVIIAEGDIVDGEGEPGKIGGDYYAKMIRDLRQDENVKAIVLRVNSGGGSAFASEKIWRELHVARAENEIPIVVSMGDVAASGGYYIAMAADKIFAETNTVTGSIGVFGIIPSVEDFLSDRLGVTFDTIRTTKFSSAISPFRDVSEAERNIIQGQVNEIYDQFIARVSDGRKMSTEKVELAAQGRVWTGEKAKELGLIDDFGGIEDAIKTANKLAKLSENSDIIYYPQTLEPLQQLISQLTSSNTKLDINDLAKNKLQKTEYQILIDQLIHLSEIKGVQMRLMMNVNDL